MSKNLSEKMMAWEGLAVEEVTEEGVRFAVALILLEIENSPEYHQDRVVRENVRDAREAWGL